MLITENKQIQSYYKALLDRDQAFVGIFFVAVKTTSVFCIATCRARKPKLQNVEFFTSFKEALDHGYRPCKVCKPTENTNEAPDQVQDAIELIKNHPKEKITDYQLREKNISPEVVRRWFNKNYGMTFQTYQRMYRINNAYQELRKGKNATNTAFDTGFESLSGFGYTYKKLIGNSPKRSLDKNLILINRLTTPLGPMFVCATNRGICLLEFVDRRMLETEFDDIQRRLNANIISGENEHIKQVKKELQEYFEGKRQSFDVKLETPGTDFQNSAWAYLQKIEYGQTVTYQQQAEKINHPKAIRAVARANGHNRISIIIPCHRVIGKDGTMTGYGGGIERKKWLIAHEQNHILSD
ncbi:XRE family transcriptional regulator [Reichenbachiella sp. 5M10]|uniref:bifunctional transcriptional activator/DNA repair enzyme AdaA n=1 Tax=Reichenbachiella sp. 5M10 TaxID=1889772 RepID=UPI000C15554B|nr:bifunctional transcriptional activator/DNA repair protein Ada [Reichenbachiella sp. 5M10]PIB34464.1 XRE family transcriptional regulator [Reichenbachiella sp. 5M10]